MQLDQKTLSRLLAMNDAQLAAVIQGIAAEAGIDPSTLSIDPSRVESIRRALGSVNESDLEALNAIYQSYRAQKGDTNPTPRR